MSQIVELRPNKDLIYSHFEGYKLSLEQVPGTNHELPSGKNLRYFALFSENPDNIYVKNIPTTKYLRSSDQYFVNSCDLYLPNT